VHQGVVYVSGVLGNGAGNADVPSPAIGDQARYCLSQIALILAEAESSMGEVLKLNVYIADLADWPEVNNICATFFEAHRPARIVVPCGSGLRLGSTIEMDVIAACAS